MICHYPKMILPALCLPESSVDVWTISLDRPVEEDDWDILESTERERAHRFRREIDRERFVVCRSILKRILGAYLNRAPERLKFEYQKRGKPFLAEAGLHFNVSHSDGKSLIAVTCVDPVGVDIEPEARALDEDEFARTVCSQSEWRRVSALPFPSRRLALLRIWVAKEAFLKLTGEGLTQPLNQLDAGELAVSFLDAIPGFVSAIALPRLTLPVRLVSSEAAECLNK
jgi:4'-phosphopantetheinyl transferase